MLRSINDLRGLTIRATDGEIGSVDQFFFDDERWSIRYLVVNTGTWLINETVLLSPQSIRSVNWESRQVEVNLTRQQVQQGATYSFGMVGCEPMGSPTSAEQRGPTHGSAHTRGRSAGCRMA